MQGYYRYPTIAGDRIVFVCEDDLWSVPAQGGAATRLTVSFGTCSYPRLSPDGAWIAFVSTDEGNPEVYVMPASGGQPRRVTFLGGTLTMVVRLERRFRRRSISSEIPPRGTRARPGRSRLRPPAGRRANSISDTRDRSLTVRTARSRSGATPTTRRVGSATAAEPPAKFGSMQTAAARSNACPCPTEIRRGRCWIGGRHLLPEPIMRASGISTRATRAANRSRATRTKPSTTCAFRRPTARASSTRPAARSPCYDAASDAITPRSRSKRLPRLRKRCAVSKAPTNRSNTSHPIRTERASRSSPAVRRFRCRFSRAR